MQLVEKIMRTDIGVADFFQGAFCVLETLFKQKNYFLMFIIL